MEITIIETMGISLQTSCFCSEQLALGSGCESGSRRNCISLALTHNFPHLISSDGAGRISVSSCTHWEECFAWMFKGLHWRIPLILSECSRSYFSSEQEIKQAVRYPALLRKLRIYFQHAEAALRVPRDLGTDVHFARQALALQVHSMFRIGICSNAKNRVALECERLPCKMYICSTCAWASKLLGTTWMQRSAHA